MLENFLKNNKIIYCDAHFHLSDCLEKNCFDAAKDIIGCSCFHSESEWDVAVTQIKDDSCRFIRAFGIHPQNPDMLLLPILEKLLAEKKLQAIGECGFDFYKPNEHQSQAFIAQINLAQKYNLPVIIHCRRANEKLFEYSSELKKLPAVLFHSFMGTPVEAQSLLRRGVSGYFSFGKQIFNGNKKVIACVKELPIERLLLETDAPFQILKGEEKTFLSEIKKIYEGAFRLRYNKIENEENESSEFLKFTEILKENFTACFGIL